METAIETSGLTKQFKSLTAVDDLTLTVPAGTVFGLLGPNGAGKTTTIQILLGLLEPTRGTARIFGLDPVTHGSEVRGRCGALLEHHGLYERFSAVRNLEFFGRVNRIPQGELNERIRHALEGLGLWDRRNEAVGKWSKGMKQKLAIARALLPHPPLIFLDEPTAGHDPASAKELRDQLRDTVARQGTTIFLSTHNLNEAEAVCSRVGILQRGRLVALGHPSELRARARNPRLVLHVSPVPPALLTRLRKLDGVTNTALENGNLTVDLAPGAKAAPIVSLLVKGGVDVEEARHEQATMEEAYIGITKGES